MSAEENFSLYSFTSCFSPSGWGARKTFIFPHPVFSEAVHETNFHAAMKSEKANFERK